MKNEMSGEPINVCMGVERMGELDVVGQAKKKRLFT